MAVDKEKPCGICGGWVCNCEVAIGLGGLVVSASPPMAATVWLVFEDDPNDSVGGHFVFTGDPHATLAGAKDWVEKTVRRSFIVKYFTWIYEGRGKYLWEEKWDETGWAYRIEKREVKS